MSSLRGMLGALLGAIAAATALRVRRIASEREQTVMSVLPHLGSILRDDVHRVVRETRGAVRDGHEAAHLARIEFEEQVAAAARRNKGNHV